MEVTRAMLSAIVFVPSALPLPTISRQPSTFSHRWNDETIMNGIFGKCCAAACRHTTRPNVIGMRRATERASQKKY
jgi:hypothetical protein